MKYNRWGRNPNTDTEFALEVRKAYAACVSYADAQVGKLVAKLKDTGADSNTIIILWGDHGWHLGEHAIWGKHALFEESLRSPLIIHTPKMSRAGRSTEAIVETIDIYPTLCELAGIKIPDSIQGTSLTPHLARPSQPSRDAISYSSRAKTIRTDRFRMILHNDGYVELYDHNSEDAETKNIAADDADVIERLKQRIAEKMQAGG